MPKQTAFPKRMGAMKTCWPTPEVDIIYNPLPNALHCEWTIKAAQAGKHVLCEKPLEIDLAEMDEVEAAAEANNVTIFEAFASLHHPKTRKIIEMVAAGELGDLQMIIA